MIIFKLKEFTRYDETDAIKRMKDSDILAEEKKKAPSFVPAVSTAAGGAALGGAALGGIKFVKGIGNSGIKAGFKAGAKGLGRGAVAGAALGLAVGLHNRSKEAEDTEFYNRRLAQAQKQARRREAADWKNNISNRDGYSY